MSERTPPPAAHSAQPEPGAAERDPPITRVRLSLTLFLLTLLSTTYVGSLVQGFDALVAGLPGSLVEGLDFSLPLMAILVAHELGHYVAARVHAVPASLPYFIPMPLPPIGTMGAVILMPGEIKSRNALLDIGAAGPLAGLTLALPVLAYGLATSSVVPATIDEVHLMEGRSLLYTGMLYALKGPIPDGYDILLNATAFAGWTGLLVTMINLIPALQLDGGHVAHALIGDHHERLSRFVRKALFPLGIGVCLAYGAPALLEGKRGEALIDEAMAGTQWLLWGAVLALMARRGDREHPATDGAPLSPRRRIVAAFTLALFVLLFMPAWLRTVHPS